MVDCSARTFGRYIPSNIVKPKPQDWGTSLCKTCLNPELKVECLRDPGVNLEWLLGLDKEQLKGFSEKHSTHELITYQEWQSERDTKTKTAKVAGQQEILIDTKTYMSVKAVCTEKKKEIVKKLLEDLQSLKERQARKISQFRRIKEIRYFLDDPSNKAAAIRMDWSENAKLFQCRQEKSAYYFDIQVSVNTAVVYQSQGNVRCVGSFSDETDHKKSSCMGFPRDDARQNWT